MKLKNLLKVIREDKFVVIVAYSHITFNADAMLLKLCYPNFLKKKVLKVYVNNHMLTVEV